MENKVYYGEYSLKHWIELILKGNIILPDYQRYFVWNEKKVETLIETFKKKQFVPPVTIGAFKNGTESQNLILDGQQRLTSILLSYIGLFPDKAIYKTTLDRFANENDEEDEEDEELDNIFEWTFEALTEKGKNKEKILLEIMPGNYKSINLNIDEDFLKTTYLGFSYLVPNINDEILQQKYYSSVFRNINIQGEPLLLQESRESLYFLDNSLSKFFNPDFSKTITVKILSSTTKLDFVRYLSLLSQYKKNGDSSKIARGYKPRMEIYYEEYIYSVVGENYSSLFVDFLTVFPNKEFQQSFLNFDEAYTLLTFPKQFTSIIELDTYIFGLTYFIVFEKKSIDISKKDLLKEELANKARDFRENLSHSKAPSALKYLKERIDASIEIFNRYTNE